jgi:metallo-beta-lactamase family protein
MLELPGFRLLLDCGLFQGRRDEAHRQNRDLGFDPKSLSAVLLSHAHVDHSGALPVLQKHGFSGKTYLTRATADLTELMLEDSARVQVSDCGYVNKKEQRKGKACVRPLYDTDDVRKLVRRFEGTRYGDMLKIAPRVTASFHDAGHILGSAAIRVKYTARGNTTTVLFSGDLGRSNMPILRDPEPPPCRAQIVKFNGLSAHADRHDLLAYVRAIRPGPSKIFLVHGEERQALSLAAAIQAEQPRIEVTVPHVGSSHEV